MSTQTNSIAFSGDIPGYYDAYLGPMFFEPFALELANRLGKIAPTRLLELAAGTGRLTKLLPAVLPREAVIIASDINPAMVRFGEKKTASQNIRWQEIDAVTLPFEDNSFDCVVVQFGVMFYSDREKAFREAYRVLKPGGAFLFTAWDQIEHNPMALLANQTLHHFFPVDTPAFYTVPFSYFDHQQILQDLGGAGFGNIHDQVISLTGSSQTAANAAAGLMRGTPTVTAIEERDAKLLPKILSHLEVRITEQFGATMLKVPLKAHVVTSFKVI